MSERPQPRLPSPFRDPRQDPLRWLPLVHGLVFLMGSLVIGAALAWAVTHG